MDEKVKMPSAKGVLRTLLDALGDSLIDESKKTGKGKIPDAVDKMLDDQFGTAENG